jgi:hypothetical protein
MGANAMKTVSHTALDGSQVQISTGLAVNEPFTSFVNVRIGSHIHEFSSGVSGYASANAADVGVAEFTDEYRFDGGTLRLGITVQEMQNQVRASLAVAAWEGARFSVFTHAYNVDTPGDLLGVLTQVRLAESATGATLAPRDPAKTPVSQVTLVKELPGLGLLQIEPAVGDLVRRLPAWRGRVVAGGELFVDNEADDARRSFVLAGSSAITRVLPDPGHQLDTVLPALTALRVDWRVG